MKTAIIVGLLLFATSIVNALPSVDEYEDMEVETSANHDFKDEDFGDFSELPNNQDPVNHGDTIALETYVRHLYVSCAGHHCARSGCPRMDMVGHDWKRCWGEVFKIYRRKGEGVVKVGDKVGFYYPRQNTWMGCAGHICGKAGCPGNPNKRFGFQQKRRWRSCWGEVFQIFVKGKSMGATVNSDDDVAIFYPRENRWVGVGPHKMRKYPCLGRKLPPKLNKYDGCVYETFHLWKKLDE